MQRKYICPYCDQYHYETDYWFVFEDNTIRRVTYTIEEATAYRKTLNDYVKTSIHYVVVHHLEGDHETSEVTFRRTIKKKQRIAVLDWISEHIEASVQLQSQLNNLLQDPEKPNENG